MWLQKFKHVFRSYKYFIKNVLFKRISLLFKSERYILQCIKNYLEVFIHIKSNEINKHSYTVYKMLTK